MASQASKKASTFWVTGFFWKKVHQNFSEGPQLWRVVLSFITQMSVDVFCFFRKTHYCFLVLTVED
jgi:hypothetical protein